MELATDPFHLKELQAKSKSESKALKPDQAKDTKNPSTDFNSGSQTAKPVDSKPKLHQGNLTFQARHLWFRRATAKGDSSWISGV